MTKKLPAREVLAELRSQGYAMNEIAALYGASRQAVYQALRTDKGETRPRASVLDVVPWEILEKHRSSAVYGKILTLARMHSGLKVDPKKYASVRNMLAEMDKCGAVLAYHPDAPPNSASTNGGFYFVPREERDGEGFFRIEEWQQPYK